MKGQLNTSENAAMFIGDLDEAETNEMESLENVY